MDVEDVDIPGTGENAEFPTDHPFAAVFRAGLSRDQYRFLEEFLFRGSINSAALHTNRSFRKRHYEWLRQTTYFESFAAARGLAAMALEEEARRRAMDGVREPVFGKNGLLGHRRRYSDSLLIELLKANAPEKYGKGQGQGKPPDNRVDTMIYLPDNGRGAPDHSKTTMHLPPGVLPPP